MEAACRGAKQAGGLTIGILPGTDPAAANPWVDIAIPTGLGDARNALVVQAGVAVVAVGGQYGTLSEIALALSAAKPVIGLLTWSLYRPGHLADAGIIAVADPREAAETALRFANHAPKR
jgi:uncharacterized protein (TIGR00725 family)